MENTISEKTVKNESRSREAPSHTISLDEEDSNEFNTTLDKDSIQKMLNSQQSCMHEYLNCVASPLNYEFRFNLFLQKMNAKFKRSIDLIQFFTLWFYCCVMQVIFLFGIAGKDLTQIPIKIDFLDNTTPLIIYIFVGLLLYISCILMNTLFINNLLNGQAFQVSTDYTMLTLKITITGIAGMLVGMFIRKCELSNFMLLFIIYMAVCVVLVIFRLVFSIFKNNNKPRFFSFKGSIIKSILNVLYVLYTISLIAVSLIVLFYAENGLYSHILFIGYNPLLQNRN
ncbi:hypothetical protein NEPAR06_2435 [Nematocida parisii]|nr:hypothetical protein NEPAR03_1603 [Nematocida parisii]KAI5129420.1 hypothetical protein NEPAR08_1570 [Nematocida parisii]KAI5141975.1 hypothetical protein NEPAR04_1331 [Nematocida parisii]KAI5157340.1 hypothetical protein NEPAR06_2435 [Nematocida parisii]